jgi:hydroxymethylglutaryl-CoA lyase
MSLKIHITECPRDAMQGIHEFIPTSKKIEYINALLDCGFSTLDFGSFVSPKAIPQMADTHEVIDNLNKSDNTKLLAIVANLKGAEQAVNYDAIDYLGYPFSVSETFQRRNTNASIEESLTRVEEIQNLAIRNGKKMVVYLSMGFGNPYGDEWNPELVAQWSDTLFKKFEIAFQALSDTIGCANPQITSELFDVLIPSNKNIQFSAHMHVKKDNAVAILKAAYESGCRKFEGALKGFGGCPMAKDDLTGNMPTEIMIDWFHNQGIETGVDMNKLNSALILSNEIFKF